VEVAKALLEQGAATEAKDKVRREASNVWSLRFIINLFGDSLSFRPAALLTPLIAQDGKTALAVIALKDTEADLFLMAVAPSVTRMWNAGEEVEWVRTLLATSSCRAHQLRCMWAALISAALAILKEHSTV
jgi:hypothetical protein